MPVISITLSGAEFDLVFGGIRGPVVSSFPAAAEAAAYDCADLYTGVISDPKHCPAFHQITPEPNVHRKSYYLFWVYRLQISIFPRPNLWAARPASWCMGCWKHWDSFFKKLIDTVPFQCEFEQKTDIDADINMNMDNREAAPKMEGLTRL